MLGHPALLHRSRVFVVHKIINSWKFLKLKVMIRSVMYNNQQLFLWTIIIIITLHLSEEEKFIRYSSWNKAVLAWSNSVGIPFTD